MKKDRLEAILQIIADNSIGTQEELAEQLAARGFVATQATVSRDIRELNLIKTAGPEGGFRYTSLSRKSPVIPEKLLPVFRNAFLSAEAANNLIVVKTLSGMANAFAAAADSMEYEGILGSIAGDDCILMVCRDEHIASGICEHFKRVADVSR